MSNKWNFLTILAALKFQGGAFTAWAGAGPNKCAEKFNQEFTRVFYKDLYSLGFSIINLYMVGSSSLRLFKCRKEQLTV